MLSRRILITGGAGFIGSHLVRRFVSTYPEYLIVNLDKLTYAGNLENLKDIEHASNYIFEKVDIVDADAVKEVFKKHAKTILKYGAAVVVMAFDEKPVFVLRVENKRGKISKTYAIILGVIRIATTLFNL